MGFDLGIFGEQALGGDFIDWLVEERSVQMQLYFGRMWEYYANTRREGMAGGAAVSGERGRCYQQAQEYGLPGRITGVVHSGRGDVFSGQAVKDIQRKEVVIENDIAWRINAGVDFLFGKPISMVCKSPVSQKRAKIEAILKAVFTANGGVSFFQDMAVLGSVYGFVDCLIRPGAAITNRISSTPSVLSAGENEDTSISNESLEAVIKAAHEIELELIEAPRALPVLEENDYKKIRYYVQHFYQKKNSLVRGESFLSRLFSSGKKRGQDRQTIAVTEIISSKSWQRYEEKELVAEGKLGMGFMPVVHIQNIAQPYYYEGLSDVEPLMGLQDELNTRLSDRANRITFQSFKMYLGKGIEGFEDRPVSPGRMWYTDNPEANIEEFGGDGDCPSENNHINEIREALDKTSGISPLAAGILRGKVGNLTSAVALKLTLMGMLSKTERKRYTYGDGLKKICRMILKMLDKSFSRVRFLRT
ncbi:MAG: phage portal protein [Planctomycetota bacterium]